LREVGKSGQVAGLLLFQSLPRATPLPAPHALNSCAGDGLQSSLKRTSQKDGSLRRNDARLGRLRIGHSGNRVIEAIARIEDVVTLEEFGRYDERGTMLITKLAMAYGAVLRYAGARVEDEDVFTGMFSDGQKQNDNVTAMMSLLSMMLPPHALHSDDDPPGGNPTPRRAGQAAAASLARLAIC
jgi:hypothetical protein